VKPRNRALCLLLLPLAAACHVPPKDPFLRAERSLQRDDLLRSLAAFDAVPVAHPRYPEARARASEVERRIRRCHELILEALMLRGEWRDREALAVLHRAQEQWAGQPSLDQWIATTEQRLAMFGDGAPQVAAAIAPQQPPAVPHVEMESVVSSGHRPEPIVQVKVDKPAVAPQPVALVVEERAVARATERAAEPAPEPSRATAERRVARDPAARERAPFVPRDVVPSPPAPSDAEPVRAPRSAPPTGDDAVALGMVAAETRLARGELVEAVADLIELLRQHPDDRRVQRRLAPLLNQRALLRYGEGMLAQAVADWRRVLQLEPDNESVRVMLEQALGETSRR